MKSYTRVMYKVGSETSDRYIHVCNNFNGAFTIKIHDSCMTYLSVANTHMKYHSGIHSSFMFEILKYFIK